MTIHQLPHRCWAVDPIPSREEFQACYPDRASAAKAVRQVRRDDDADPATKAIQFSAPHWVIRCDGDCGEHIDQEDEGYVVHCLSRADAEQMIAAYEWTCADGFTFCPEDAPEGAELPPPSPAEQEAAGQMSLLAECQEPR